MKRLLITSLLACSINVYANDNSALLEWTTKNTLETFNYNALNFKEKLSSLETKFTAPGWQRYKKALDSSGNIDYVVANNLIVKARSNGAATINQLATEKWEVTIPAIVLYLNEYFTITQDITTHVTVEKTHGSDKYAISDINSILNKPATISEATPQRPSSCQAS